MFQENHPADVMTVMEGLLFLHLQPGLGKFKTFTVRIKACQQGQGSQGGIGPTRDGMGRAARLTGKSHQNGEKTWEIAGQPSLYI